MKRLSETFLAVIFAISLLAACGGGENPNTIGSTGSSTSTNTGTGTGSNVSTDTGTSSNTGTATSTSTATVTSKVTLSGSVSGMVAKPQSKPGSGSGYLYTPLSGGEVKVIDSKGITIASTTVGADGAYSVAVDKGSDYVIRATKGNVCLKSFVEKADADKTVTVDPASSAVVKVLGKKIGNDKLGEEGEDVSNVVGSTDVAAIVTAINKSGLLTTIAQAIQADIASHADYSAATVSVGAASTAGNDQVNTLALNINITITVVSNNQQVSSPDAPKGVTVTVGDGQIAISWNAVTGATSYNVYYSTVQGVSGLKINGIGSGTTYTLTGITNGATYYLQVTAVNAGGESMASGQVSGAPQVSVSGSPTGLTISSGDGQTILGWNAVAGAASYKVYWSTTASAGKSGTAIAVGNAISYTHTGLTNGTTYYYVVTAVNAGGESAASAMLTGTPQVSVAGVPPGVSTMAGDAQVTVSWNAVTGAASYNLYYATTSNFALANGTKVTGAASPKTVTGLANGTTYYFKLTAVNAGGESAASNEASAKPQVPAPSAPTGVTGSAGDSQTAISWNAVTGAASYNIYWGTAPGVTKASGTKIAGATSPYNHTGRTNDTAYFYIVTAVNAGGESAASLEVSGTPQLPLPAAPGGVSAVGGDAQATVSWNAVTGATSYNLYYSTTSNFMLSSGTKITGAVSPKTATALAGGTIYYFKVTAVNARGESAASTEVSATTQVSVAGIPTGVTATPGDATVSLTWTAISGATYKIYRSTVSGTQGALLGTSTTANYTDSTVVNGTTYYYTITAVNAGGESSGSTQTSATPQPPVPGAPTGVTATAGNGQVAVSWTVVAGAASYNIYYLTTSGVTTANGTKVTGATSGSAITGLTNNITYYFVVTAANTAGESAISSEVTAFTTLKVPRFAYVANLYSNNISVYTIDQTTGALTAGTAVASLTGPRSVTVDPSGKFAYVANEFSNTVSVYTIDQTTGALAAVGTPVAAGTGSVSITVDPSGKFAYVANYISNTVSVYTISQTTGALTAGTAVVAGTYPVSVTVDPSGKFAYVANAISYNVSVYIIDQTTGALTAGTAVAAGTDPRSVTVDPSGKFAYVANNGSGTVSVYTINQTTGALTAGTAVAAGTNAESVTVAPSGRFAYVANNGSSNVSVYTINQTTGALTAVAGSPFAAGTVPYSVTVDPSGRFIYVANLASNNVSVYTINQATGALTAVAGSPFAAGTTPVSVTTSGSIQ